jgi:hypothetical protein
VEEKTAYAISCKGALEIARHMGNIGMLDFKAQEHDDAYHVMVRGKGIVCVPQPAFLYHPTEMCISPLPVAYGFRRVPNKTEKNCPELQ